MTRGRLTGGRAALGLLAAVLTPSLASAHAEPVKLSIAPFVWVPSLKGELSTDAIAIPLDVGPGDLIGGIKGGAMVHAEASFDHIQASVQTMYVDFHQGSFVPVFGADVRSSLFTVEALAGPRLRRGTIEVVPMVGLRHTRITGTFDAPGLGRLKAARQWQEALLGLELQAPVSPQLSLRTRATYAIGGPSGQHSSDVIVAGSYRLGRSTSLVGGYRWASERVYADGAESLGMELNGRGPIVGVVFEM